MVDVCICTHNPRINVLKDTIESILAQTSDRQTLNVLIVDNRSEPPIDSSLLRPLAEAGIAARISREDTLGTAVARYRAIRETSGEWLLFVDDDNELASNYIAVGSQFILENPDVGCFGGKLLAPESIIIPAWITPFLHFLAIKDLGEKKIKSKSQLWTECEPPGAGAWVRRDVAELYADRLDRDDGLTRLGAIGGHENRCEDSFMMRGAYDLNLENAYCPSLRLVHNLSPNRFTFPYILNLMAGFGRSLLLLDKKLLGEHADETVYEDPTQFANRLDYFFLNKELSGRFRAARMIWEISARSQHLKDLEAATYNEKSTAANEKALNGFPELFELVEEMSTRIENLCAIPVAIEPESVDGGIASAPPPADVSRVKFVGSTSSQVPTSNVLGMEVDFREELLPDFVEELNGFGTSEVFGRWSNDDISRIIFFSPLPDRFTLFITMKAHGLNVGQPIVIVAGGEANIVNTTDEMRCYEVKVHSRVRSRAIEFFVPHAISPKQLTDGEHNDARRIGLAFASFRLAPWNESEHAETGYRNRLPAALSKAAKWTSKQPFTAFLEKMFLNNQNRDKM